MDYPVLYRKRLIPSECVLLKDDKILFYDGSILVTCWKALKPKPDLHHGRSVCYLDRGYKISEFYDKDNNLLYTYCDIIKQDLTPDNALIITDLLADVIVYPDGRVKVVDIDEFVEALNEGSLPLEDLKSALLSLSSLLEIIYDGRLLELKKPFDLKECQ